MSYQVPHLQPGALLAGGNYKIIRFIGAGGFGCTYEAEDAELGIRVAIKEFYINDFCDRDATGAVSIVSKNKVGFIGKLREKFVREARNIARLRHPNIVRVSGRFDENGTSYYVMDYISGHSLQWIVDNQGPLPQARAVKYISQVMDALECVHDENMLHLDVKPDNIMIDAKDNAILIDFGVSKQYDEIDGHNTSTIMGQTPGYAPPEQVGNSLRQFSRAADIYALGATLYTVLTGLTPPPSTDIVSGFAHLSPLPPGTSPSISSAIGLMMQPNASHRPQTIKAARALLGGIENGKLKIENSVGAPAETKTTPSANVTAPSIGGIPPVATGPSAQTPDKSTELVDGQPRSKKWLWAAVAAAVVAIGIVAFLLMGKGSEKQPDPIAQAVTADTLQPAIEQPKQDVTGHQTDYCRSPNPEGEPTEGLQPEPADMKAAERPEPGETQQQDEPTSGIERGYEWLDMGTSVKWATMNVGASFPKDDGEYFAWGGTYKTESGNGNGKTYGDGSVGNIAGRAGYDAARANWGGGWRMPTKEEWQELIDNCDWDWYGDGMKVTAKNGNVLYLPAVLVYIDSSINYVENQGCFWSASPRESETAWCLSVSPGGKGVDYYPRSNGFSVRPVLD